MPVLEDKTQGEPYHVPLLAAAMLFEDRFRRHALVSGDIDAAQAAGAQAGIREVLGRKVAHPVRANAPALVRRLRPRFKGDALVGAFDELYLAGDPVARYQVALRGFPRPRAERWWCDRFRECGKPTTVGSLWLLIGWLNANRDLVRLCELACIEEDGLRHPPKRPRKNYFALSWIDRCLGARASGPRSAAQRAAPPGASRSESAQLFLRGR
ncbi:MAG: hypothetical protein HYZ53_27925 [Planctomycetes bacterium]|nr:hypothetical protein [Planctomycetota bacterium]